MILKKCGTCKQDLNIEKFSFDKNSKDSRCSICKECNAINMKKYYIEYFLFSKCRRHPKLVFLSLWKHPKWLACKASLHSPLRFRCSRLFFAQRFGYLLKVKLLLWYIEMSFSYCFFILASIFRLMNSFWILLLLLYLIRVVPLQPHQYRMRNS